jgi:hypothetical protein
MKSYIIIPVLIVVMALGIITYVDIPTADSLVLDKNATIVAGEGENCITPYSEITCKEGLECMLISEKPYKNGVCLPIGTKLDEDLINRYMKKNN